MSGAIRFRVFTGERPLTTNQADSSHWSKRGGNKTDWHKATWAALNEAAVKRRFDRAGFRIHPYYPPPVEHHPDAGGLYPTVKAIVDACVHNGMLPDDNPFHNAYEHFAAPVLDESLTYPVLLVIVIPKPPVTGHGSGECDCKQRRERAQAKAAMKRAG